MTITHVIKDCNGQVFGFLYVDPGRQPETGTGYCFMPSSHGFAQVIHGTPLEEAIEILRSFECSVEEELCSQKQ